MKPHFYKLSGKIPVVGDKVALDQASLEVMEMESRRISKLLLKQTAPEAASEPPQTNDA